MVCDLWALNLHISVVSFRVNNYISSSLLLGKVSIYANTVLVSYMTTGVGSLGLFLKVPFTTFDTVGFFPNVYPSSVFKMADSMHLAANMVSYFSLPSLCEALYGSMSCSWQYASHFLS